ncbi:MAG TPA: response regulator, partial [Ktedonobacteraceae bacterium]|nr:response regulator [Ktedonobacteraceae bacterium]
MSIEMPETPSSQEKSLQIILVVEDDEAIGDLLVQILKSETPYVTLLVTDAMQALETVKSIKPGLFILDYHLPGINGVELHDRLHAIKGLETVPTLMMSARAPARQAIGQRHITLLRKPFELATILKAISSLLDPQEES